MTQFIKLDLKHKRDTKEFLSLRRALNSSCQAIATNKYLSVTFLCRTPFGHTILAAGSYNK